MSFKNRLSPTDILNATGTPSSSTFLRGDNSWATPAGGGGGVTDGDKGDITVSASGATWTIDNDAVTYAKMQNISATSRILGRKTASAGDTEECTLSEVLDFIGSAAQGDILFRGASAWTRLGAGTSGQVLQSGGAGANPSWTSISGSNPWTIVRKTSDESRTTNTTLTNDSALQFSFAANTKYHIKGLVLVSTGGTPDFKYSFNGPASPTRIRIAKLGLENGATSYTGLNPGVDTAYGVSSVFAGTGVEGYVQFEAFIENGANTGTFAFQWAQNSSNATATSVMAGSYLEYATY